MSQGQYVFTQLCSFLPKRIFDCLVDKYDGNKWVKSFTCWHHLLVMVFGQLSNRKSMRDLIVTLNAHRSKFYRLGLGKSVTRSNLSKANEVREARIFKELFIINQSSHHPNSLKIRLKRLVRILLQDLHGNFLCYLLAIRRAVCKFL